MEGLRQAADNYRATVEHNLFGFRNTLGQVHVDMGAVVSKLAEIAAEMTAEKQRLTTLTSDFQAQFSKAQESRNQSHQDAQDARQTRFSSMIDEYTKNLNEQQTSFAKKRDELFQLQKEEVATLKAAYESQAEKVLKQIDAHRAQVEKLVGVIGNLGVTSGYQKAAREAKITTWVWQGITVASLLIIIRFAFVAFLPVMQGDFHWASFAARVFLTVTVGLLAAYAIHQADRYQLVERRSRKLALELESVGPFLANMPEAKQQEFILDLGKKTFGTSDDLLEHPFKESPKSVLDLIGPTVQSVVNEVVDAKLGKK